jgi:hypothetical protein
MHFMPYRWKGWVYVNVLLYYLLSLQYIYRTPAIVNPKCDEGFFSPSRFTAHRSPKNSARQRARQPLLNQMLRRIMQAYKPKQGVCEAMLLCARSTFMMISVSTSLLLFYYYFLFFTLCLWSKLESIGPVFIDIVWNDIPVFCFYDSAVSNLATSRLSLTGAGGPAVGGGRAVLLASGQGGLSTAESPLDLLGSGEGLILHLNQGAGRAAAALLNGLLVGGDVESNEQNEVAGQDAHAGKRSELLTGADAGGRQPGEVAGGEVGVGGEVDEAQVDDELGDLQDGDVLLPPNADATRSLEVVPVHDDVDGEVEGDDNPGNSGVAEELGVAEKGGGTVVVGVQEGQRLLLEDKEDGVNQLEVLGQVVQLGDLC